MGNNAMTERGSHDLRSQFSENELTSCRQSSMGNAKQSHGDLPQPVDLAEPEPNLDFDEKFIYDSYLEKERLRNEEEQVQEMMIKPMDMRWRRLKLLSKYHICQIVSELISQAHVDWKWEPYLQKFVIRAVDSVKPSSRYLKDSMDFNQYVDIQIVDN